MRLHRNLAKDITANSFIDTTTSLDTSYYYFIRACNGTACAKSSAGINAILLSSPHNAKVLTHAEGLEVQWDANEHADLYGVYRGQTEDFTQSEILEENAASSSFVDTTASLDTPYFYFITSCNQNGCSEISSPLYAVKLSQPTNPAS